MKFARVGGLSPVKYKKGAGRFDAKGFHAPPEQHGIYAFIWPYIELFLVCWSEDNRKELEHDGLRKFDYSGFVWAHIGQGSLHKGSWIYQHTDDLSEAVRKENHTSLGGIHKDMTGWDGKFIPKTKAFGQGYSYSKEHLEVFIPQRFLGKIR